ncbi:MAG: GxGYxYP family putative glycoside hydrolase [Candidatus Pseudobacter hemicellulosilyticus]|uniref:GxGYxYP family putative glycoside hydrolase n=1 Tax=Candidatus Pseudobacter hemicellulosilyticus TaxID=3121375 RepID=A0AAJ5X0U3_9BACT|nr:MAG: GxGYxYP family putative glycoside hydrolase [Pseudobacter sp.]
MQYVRFMKKCLALFLCCCLTFSSTLFAQKPSPAYEGNWVLIPDSSSFIPYFSGCELAVRQGKDSLQLSWKWLGGNPHIDQFAVALNGKPSSYPIDNRVWPYENFMGVNYIPGTQGVATYIPGRPAAFTVKNRYQIKIAQGQDWMEHRDEYALSPNGQLLTVKHYRNHRSRPMKYVFRKAGDKTAWVHAMKNNWLLKEGMGENAFFVSLQGVVNMDTARLYLDYPKDWEYKESGNLQSFYERRLGYNFLPLNTIAQALATFKDHIKGYIVWDKESRSSLCVAFTMAGLRNAVVVTPELVPLMETYHIPLSANLQGRFNGKSDYEVFSWAWHTYRDSCSKDYVLWMGGVDGDQMMPGIADFGVARKALVVDLSTAPKDTLEYRLSDSIMAYMNRFALVVGWHSYAKDLERHYVTLASRHGLRVEGLNTFPNLSFTSRTPPSKDFRYKNNHQLVKGKNYVPQNKVYITCVQTDGLGLGSWNSPHRGSIPYSWEVTINWHWMAPVLLQYYYENATPNDYFFGSLSGPGYMYPKAIPDSLFVPLMQIADSLCKQLDLNVFETMDYSEGSSGTGNNDLPKDLVEKYFKAMPDMLGILNGYAPSYTFGMVDKKPFISYDYYLDERIPEQDAADDLNELIAINGRKPYFLALHVREWNDIERVKRILDKIQGPKEVIALDVFLKLAAANPTWKEYYLPRKK